jgi:hypothetical protein
MNLEIKSQPVGYVEQQSEKAGSEVNVKSSPDGHAVNRSMLDTEEASAIGSALNGSALNEDVDEYRSFNEIDIVGDLDRDDRGNLVLTRFDGK